MQIDNQRNTYRIWLSRLVLTIVFTMAILVILLLPWFDNPESLVSKYHLIILLALIYMVINLYNYLMRPYFVSYSDEGEMIIVRYYPLSLFTSRKHSIEIPKQQLIGYELQPFLFGTQHRLVLIQHFRNKTAKYPAISLSALDKDERERMLHSLDRYSRTRTQ
jgi:hypothetical protein